MMIKQYGNGSWDDCTTVSLSVKSVHGLVASRVGGGQWESWEEWNMNKKMRRKVRLKRKAMDKMESGGGDEGREGGVEDGAGGGEGKGGETKGN